MRGNDAKKQKRSAIEVNKHRMHARDLHVVQFWLCQQGGLQSDWM